MAKQNPKRRGASSFHESAVTILTPGCHFDGKFFCRGSSRIAGRIQGQIVSEGMLIIEEGAIITAEIQAEEVVVQGTISGKLVASGRVELASSSVFDGDITCPSLVINEGAQFNGTSKMITQQEGKDSGKVKKIKFTKDLMPENTATGKQEPDIVVPN